MSGKDRPNERRALEDTTAARLAEIVGAAERAAKQVIDDAEAAARKQLDEADAEAARIVAERIGRLGEVVDRLAAQAEAIKRQSEELLDELARARDGLDAGPGPSANGAVREARTSTAPADAPARKSHLSAVTLVAEEPEPAPAVESEDPPEGPDAAPIEDGPAALEDAPAAMEVALDPPLASAPGSTDGPDRTPAGARLLATQMAVSGSSRQEIEQRLRNGFEIEDTTAILDAILGPEAS